MKTLLAMLILAFSAAGQIQRGPLSHLSWISGCWESRAGAEISTEQWGPTTSDMIVGVSQTVRDGKTTSYEYLRTAVWEKGPSYIAKPGQAALETEFKFLRGSNSEIVLENLEHDFPQRIIYRSGGRDRLTARVEGEVGGKRKGTDFQMKRVGC